VIAKPTAAGICVDTRLKYCVKCPHDYAVDRPASGALDEELPALGPSETGKSTLIRGLAPALSLNLASEATFLEFARNPSELEQRLAAGRYRTVFIDEVQRLPALLNTIQALLDEQPYRPVVAYLGTTAKVVRGVAVLPWQSLLRDLGL